jgi:penicillin-binding protein 1A
MTPGPPNRHAYDDVLAHIAARQRKRRGQKRRRGSRSRLAVAVVVGLVSLLSVLVVGGVAGAIAVDHMVSGLSVNAHQNLPGENTRIYDRNGNLIAVIPSTENRFPVRSGQISPWLKKATVDIEDRRFWTRSMGIDPEGIVRALLSDLTAGRIVSGGSTIEQQVVRALWLSPQQTFTRKIKEMDLAIQLADHWSKQRILTTYLNIVPYGGVTYGCQAAARTYFDTRCAHLSIAQAALLAGLPQSPTQYNPFIHPGAALARRAEVLQAMLAQRTITQKEYAKAMATPLRLHNGEIGQHPNQPYFVSYVKALLDQTYGAGVVSTGGLTVRTTIDQTLQKDAERAMHQVLYWPGAPAAAMVAMDPRTGAILALQSSTSYRQTKFNFPVQAKRQAGSSFKPFGLAAAMYDLGVDPYTTYYSSAQPFKYYLGPGATPSEWTVYNSEQGSGGAMPLNVALQDSVNTVYAQLSVDIGAFRTAQMAYRMGIPRSDHLPSGPTDYSVILGTGLVSPLDMTTAYSTFADMGVRHEPLAITHVTSYNGSINVSTPPDKNPGKRVLPDGIPSVINSILEANVHSFGTGLAANVDLSGLPERPQAGKTGTTENNSDAWWCGYTPNLAACVWVGFPGGEIPMQNLPLGPAFGGSYAAPIWEKFAAAAFTQFPNEFPPVNWPAPLDPFVPKPFHSQFSAVPPATGTTTTTTTTTGTSGSGSTGTGTTGTGTTGTGTTGTTGPGT